MELFKSAKAVRLRSHHNKYLVAEEDEENVRQERGGSSRSARWTVEFVGGSSTTDSLIRLKSCYGRYLSASGEPFLLGMTGRKVLQTSPARPDDSSVLWEPVRDGFQARLRTRYGHFLRANGGLPPWRNSVTHDTPHRTATQNWVLWDVEIVEVAGTAAAAAAAEEGRYGRTMPSDKPRDAVSSPRSTLSAASTSSPRLSTESSSSLSGSPHKSDGRTIYYAVAEDDGTVDTSGEESFSFKGTSVAELTEKLEEETALSGIIVCSRNPLNGKLCPLRLQLPPNNSTMHIVVVQASSKVAKSFNKP